MGLKIETVTTTSLHVEIDGIKFIRDSLGNWKNVYVQRPASVEEQVLLLALLQYHDRCNTETT